MSSQGRFNRWLTGFERLGKFITTTIVIVGLVSPGVVWIAYRIHGRTVQVWIPIALFFGLVAFNVLFVAFALARRPGAIDEATGRGR